MEFTPCGRITVEKKIAAVHTSTNINLTILNKQTVIFLILPTTFFKYIREEITLITQKKIDKKEQKRRKPEKTKSKMILNESDLLRVDADRLLLRLDVFLRV